MATPINKVLGQIKPATDALTLLYKVPANVHHTTISGINVCNQDAANNKYCVTLAVNDAAFSANQYLYYNSTVEKNATTLAFVGATLQPNDAIYVQSVAANLGVQLLDGDGGTTASVSIDNNSANVTGTNTVFTAITPGSTIRVLGVNKVINRITSDTSMNLTSTWTGGKITNVPAYLPGFSDIVYNVYGIEYIQPPVITGLSATTGNTGGEDSVTITGNNFFNVASVKFGSKFAQYSVVSNTSITATTPSSTAMAVNVVVEADGGLTKTNANSQFTYVDTTVVTQAPSITSLSVNTSILIGGGGLTITGNNFVNVVGVKFGELYSYSVITANSTTINASIPPAFAYGPVDVVVVSTNGESATGDNTKFTYTED